MPGTGVSENTHEEAGDESPGLSYGNHSKARVLSSTCRKDGKRCAPLLRNIRAKDTPRTGSAREHPESKAKPIQSYRFVCQTSHSSISCHRPPADGDESYLPRRNRCKSDLSVRMTTPQPKHGAEHGSTTNTCITYKIIHFAAPYHIYYSAQQKMIIFWKKIHRHLGVLLYLAGFLPVSGHGWWYVERRGQEVRGRSPYGEVCMRLMAMPSHINRTIFVC